MDPMSINYILSNLNVKCSKYMFLALHVIMDFRPVDLYIFISRFTPKPLDILIFKNVITRD